MRQPINQRQPKLEVPDFFTVTAGVKKEERHFSSKDHIPRCSFFPFWLPAIHCILCRQEVISIRELGLSTVHPWRDYMLSLHGNSSFQAADPTRPQPFL